MLKTILNRLQSTTPKFFKIIRNIAATVAALSLLVVSLESKGVQVPAFVGDLLNLYTLSSAAIAVFVSQLTQIWSDEEIDLLLEEEEPVEYPAMTERERLIIDVEEAGPGFTVYQVDFLVGYYTISLDLTWEYIGTRPPRKPK